MIIPSFEDLRITTMTLVLTLTNSIDMKSAFHLLPITRVEVKRTRESAKCKLPHCEIPGAIISMRFHNDIRGIIRSKGKPFKNAVTMDISTSVKNISLKLSPFSIQMCGASSRDDGLEAASHVLNHLHYIQNLLDKIHNYPDIVKAAINWVKTNTKGISVEKSLCETKEFNNIKLVISSTVNRHTIVIGENYLEDLPDEIPEDLVEFLVGMSSDFLHHEDFCHKIDCIPKFPNIIQEPLAIMHINEAMVNYNYSLGFEVNRPNLKNNIDGKNAFIARFNNALSNSVTVELRYEPPADTTIKRRKNKIPHHTFLIYRSGSVTQSGPGGDLMREAYYLFMNTIQEIADKIRFDINQVSIM